jgi:hypothetical protein
MGCCGGSMPGGDNEVTEMLKEVTEKIVKIQEEYNTLEESREKEKILKERHDVLAAADKNNEEALTKLIKVYNGKELEIDNKLIKKEVTQKVKMYELGLEYSEVLREKLLAKLEQKVTGVGGAVVKKQIEKIKKLSPAEFFDSEFGKPLKDLLKKYGLTDTAMKDYMDKLLKERAERRKKEREEFGIAVNEYPDEEIYEAAQKDLYNDMLKETADKYMEKIKK